MAPPARNTRSGEELDALIAAVRSASGFRHGRGRGLLVTSFRVHLAIYVVVNVMLIGIWAVSHSDHFWPVWSILGWGIFVGCHGALLIGGRPDRHAAAPTLDERHRPRPEGDPLGSVDEMAVTVAAERPSLRRAAAPDGTVTILFSDIEGSTALNERLGDMRWLELLRAHNRLVRDQIEACGGFEVKSQGDGFMIAFPSARRAIQCAKAIQEAIGRDLGSRGDGQIRVRIGLHTGEAIREDSDFYGKNVVVAARITDEARGGEILASSVVKQLTESAGDVVFEDAREVELPGLAGRHEVYKVV